MSKLLEFNKEADSKAKEELLPFYSQSAGLFKPEKSFKILYQHYNLIRNNRDFENKDFMEQKGFITFLTDFKIMPFLISKEEAITVFN